MERRRLRVLNVEDSEDDALLLLRQLRRAGYEVVFERVETREAMEAALKDRTWDIVIADYVLPSFSAPAALALMRESTPNLPCIFVSGALGEDAVSVAANEAGVEDYLLKSQLAQLVPAIGLAAGVVPSAELPAAHLGLCKAYLEPGGNPAKAALHAEQAWTLALDQGPDGLSAMGQAALCLGAALARQGRYAEAAAALRRVESVHNQLDRAMLAEIRLQLGLLLAQLGESEEAAIQLEQAATEYQALGLVARADACRMQLERVKPGAAGDGPGATGNWAALMEAARAHLMVGDPVQAVRDGLEALRQAGEDSERCFQCYMLLKRCARVQGHVRDAMNFAISARLMALDARRPDLALDAARELGVLVAQVGEEAEVLLRELDEEYRRWGVDLSDFLPRDPGDTWE